jgi:hypothetical protein
MVMPAFLLILISALHYVKSGAALWLAAIAITAAATVRAVDLAWRRLESSSTGHAKWIWDAGAVTHPAPLRFTASRSLVIAEPVSWARAKIFVQDGYVLRLDGQQVGAGEMRPGDPLDVYDLSSAFPPGVHVFEIEAESATGIGGILFALDISGHGRGAVVSDGSWRIRGRPAWVWGEPPIYPWLFPLEKTARAFRAAAQ